MLHNSKTYLFVIIFILPLSIAYYPDYDFEECDFGIGNYTEDSLYHENLMILLTSLSKSTLKNGYFNDTIGSNGTNEVFGYAMCRGDLQLPEDCKPCLHYAVSEITKLCPYEKNAAISYEECFLRYSNENFFGKPTGIETYSNKKMNLTKDQEKFFHARADLFSKLLVEATNHSTSPPFFAAGGQAVTSDLSVFGLLQCGRDLSEKDCSRCLDSNIQDVSIYSNYSVGAMHVGKSCFVIFENKLFYNGKVPPSLAPSLPPSLPPPETSPETHKGNSI